MFDIASIYEATCIADAVRTLNENPQAIVIAGGTDVLIKIREGKLAGCQLVSIGGLEELRGISLLQDGTIAIGPLSTFTEIAHHPVVLEHIPVLAHAVEQIGGPQIRNTGTVGGNLCNGVTSADSASTLFALQAEVELTGPAGKRRMAIAQFYTGPGKVSLAQGELLTGIFIPKAAYLGCGGHYTKFAPRAAMDIATLGCAAVCRLSPDKTRIEELRLAFGVAGPVPMRCEAAEVIASGQVISPALLEQIAQTACKAVQPRSSWRASREYRLQLVYELSRRTVEQAICNGGGVVHA